MEAKRLEERQARQELRATRKVERAGRRVAARQKAARTARKVVEAAGRRAQDRAARLAESANDAPPRTVAKQEMNMRTAARRPEPECADRWSEERAERRARRADDAQARAQVSRGSQFRKVLHPARKSWPTAPDWTRLKNGRWRVQRIARRHRFPGPRDVDARPTRPPWQAGRVLLLVTASFLVAFLLSAMVLGSAHVAPVSGWWTVPALFLVAAMSATLMLLIAWPVHAVHRRRRDTSDSA